MKNKLYFQNRHDHLKLIGENIEENEVEKGLNFRKISCTSTILTSGSSSGKINIVM